MATSYPGGLDSFTNPGGADRQGDEIGTRTHSEMHADINDAMEAVQTALGINPAVIPGAPSTYTPTFDATDVSPTYTIDTVGGAWGAPSYGKYVEAGPIVRYSMRIVTGSNFGTFDPGEGFFLFPPPVPISSDVDFAGQGHIVHIATGFGSAIRYPVTMVLDAVYSATDPVMFVDNPSGDFLTGTVLAASVSPGDFPVLLDGPIVIFVANGWYWAA